MKKDVADRLRVTTSDGKYTVIQGEEGGLSFLRHGEPWPAADREFAHVGMILALAQELSSAQEALRFAIDFKITDGSGNEVVEDSLHEARKMARRALEVNK